MQNLRRLLALIPDDWDRGDFVLCGSAALAFRGVRDVHDLDVLVKRHLFPGLAPDRESAYQTARVVLRSDSGIDLFDSLPRLGKDTPDPFETADVFEGFRVLSLRHVLAIKAACGRPSAKDRADMISLAHLIAQEEAAAEPPVQEPIECPPIS